MILSGVREAHKLVSRTYGPTGAPVLIEKNGAPFATTDGASVLREAQLGDKRRIGMALVREAARETEMRTGDGTTSTALVTAALASEMGKYLVSVGSDPHRLVAEVRAAEKVALERVLGISEDADRTSLDCISLAASHWDSELAEKVVEAALLVGEEGNVTLMTYEGVGVVLEHQEGMRIPHGWASFEMAPKTGGLERVLDGPLVVVSGTPLTRLEHVAPMMEAASQWPGRGLVVFAPQIYGDALATMTTNDGAGVLPCVGVEYSGSPRELRGWLDDLAAVTNAEVLDPVAGRGSDSFKDEWLGYARKITVKRDMTTILSYLDEKVSDRIDRQAARLKAESETCAYPYERDRLKERAAALDGGLCLLKVGGYTKQEAQDRRSRAEDAVQSVQRALQGGVVPGAGWTVFLTSTYLPDTDGGKLLALALQEPLRVLAERSGLEPASTLAIAKRIASDGNPHWFGLDPVAKDWRDLKASPRIVDSTDVLVAVITGAVSIACQIALVGGIVLRRN